MSSKALMLDVDDAHARARASFDRNWREWACCHAFGEPCSANLSIGLHPPRESDLESAAGVARARAWTQSWRACELPGIEWQRRHWPRAGDQDVPIRVRLERPADIALWGSCAPRWEKGLSRLDDLMERVRSLQNYASALTSAESRSAIRASLATWCELEDSDWRTTLDVLDWLLAHPDDTRFIRQLPIRGVHTKWIENHGKAVDGIYRALSGHSFAFATPQAQFLCKACCPGLRLGGCDEFSLSAIQLAKSDLRPHHVIICENKVNTLCLDDMDNVLAIHGSGFAVTDLCAVPWLAETPILYWGDLDSNGFAILNALRKLLPHVCSALMDAATLHRHFDLCVNEPKPATGTLEHLTSDERDTFDLLAEGDPARGIANLRLEQERIEWNWATKRIRERMDDRLST